MHECIRKLLVQTDEESLECLCRLVSTVGQVNGDYHIYIQCHHHHHCQILEQETAAVLTKGGQAGFSNLDEYFASMNKLVMEKKISSRIKFLMQVRNSV